MLASVWAQVGLVTIDQAIDIVSRAGPTGIMTLMWFLERKERIRQQNLVEGYLPTSRSIARTSRALRRVLDPDTDPEDGG